jgi:hypothetical protein
MILSQSRLQDSAWTLHPAGHCTRFWDPADGCTALTVPGTFSSTTASIPLCPTVVLFFFFFNWWWCFSFLLLCFLFSGIWFFGFLRQGLTMQPRLAWKSLCTPAGLQLAILLPQLPKCWDYRCAPPHPAWLPALFGGKLLEDQSVLSHLHS